MPTALVTGPTGGIGREVVRGLVREGYNVILAARSRERAEGLVSEVGQAADRLHHLQLDLSSLASVAADAAAVERRADAIDLLVNNAGLIGRGLTSDGFELVFGVNYLSHFLLTLLLLPGLRRPPSARVVNVSSDAHYGVGRIEYVRVRAPTRSYQGVTEYRRSKLAMVLHTAELAKREPGLTAVAVHPGSVATGMWKPLPRPIRGLVMRRLMTPAAGGAVVLRASNAPDVVTGSYLRPSGPAPPSPAARDPAAAAELWGRSEAWVESFVG